MLVALSILCIVYNRLEMYRSNRKNSLKFSFCSFLITASSMVKPRKRVTEGENLRTGGAGKIRWRSLTDTIISLLFYQTWNWNRSPWAEHFFYEVAWCLSKRINRQTLLKVFDFFLFRSLVIDFYALGEVQGHQDARSRWRIVISWCCIQ